MCALAGAPQRKKTNRRYIYIERNRKRLIISNWLTQLWRLGGPKIDLNMEPELGQEHSALYNFRFLLEKKAMKYVQFSTTAKLLIIW